MRIHGFHKQRQRESAWRGDKTSLDHTIEPLRLAHPGMNMCAFYDVSSWERVPLLLPLANVISTRA